ncbi:MAG: hypothetical protein KKG92_04830 [Gammaproteobacteria bacterium]|nr:hypothetical protein [Gammaproteobacteria bacterium]MDP2430446.1 hypothetical protein [Pseudomonadota bacterium]
MPEKHLITADSCKRSARLFNYGTIAGALLPIPLGMLWIAGSMFVYAANAHHPDPRVAHYIRWGGYRFYAVAGTVTVFSNDMAAFLGGGAKGWLAVWALAIVLLVPWSLYDIWKAGREDWKDIEVEKHK